MTGCADTYQNYGRWSTWTPRPYQMRNIPQGDDSYSLGFRDGCNTGIGLVGSAMLQNHDFSYDAARALEDKDYAQGFRAGQGYCVGYVDPVVF